MLVPGSRPNRLNNPGDLEYHEWMIPFGATMEVPKYGGKPRFAQFPTRDQGYQALRHLCGLPIYEGKTVAEFFAIYAPAGENQPNVYAANVCRWTPCQLTDLVSSLL